jgi:hypothetical protein
LWCKTADGLAEHGYVDDSVAVADVGTDSAVTAAYAGMQLAVAV